MSSERPLERGLLFVVSAPSGTGKTTVVERLVRRIPGLEQSRSYTSRPVRDGELDGVDYNFISRDAFEEMVQQDAFLEWANVFGHFYGTGRRETDERLLAGADVVLVIDVQGARQVRAYLPNAIAVFVLPPSFEVLEQRLRGRCRDDEETIRRRLATARTEVAAAVSYDYVVVNDDLDRCVREIGAIVAAERARLSRRLALVGTVAKTFETL
jgi:guanylate kinase